MIFFLNLLEPGTLGPFTSDLVRAHLHRDFPGASPTSTRKASVQRKELFHQSMVITKNMDGTTSTPSQDDSAGSSGPSISQAPLHNQHIPPDQMIGNLVIDEAPREPRQPRKRDPPDFQDVVTQQTKILAGMLAKLRARQAQLAAPAANQADWLEFYQLKQTFRCQVTARYNEWLPPCLLGSPL